MEHIYHLRNHLLFIWEGRTCPFYERIDPNTYIHDGSKRTITDEKRDTRVNKHVYITYIYHVVNCTCRCVYKQSAHYFFHIFFFFKKNDRKKGMVNISISLNYGKIMIREKRFLSEHISSSPLHEVTDGQARNSYIIRMVNTQKMERRKEEGKNMIMHFLTRTRDSAKVKKKMYK